VFAEGEYDGVLGFSQGATLTSLLCTTQGIRATGFTPQFAIMVAGRANQEMCHWYDTVRPGIPSLHIWGKIDKINSSIKSKQLADGFAQKQVVEHPKGHLFPECSESIEAIDFFIKQHT